jgi:hypothetical protein
MKQLELSHLIPRTVDFPNDEQARAASKIARAVRLPNPELQAVMQVCIMENTFGIFEVQAGQLQSKLSTQ